MFHDTLPGSSIHLAVEDYDRKFAAIHKLATNLFDEAVNALDGGSDSGSKGVVNTLPSHPRREIVSLPNQHPLVASFDGHTLFGQAEKYEPVESEGVTGVSGDGSF
jgi:alpha-mannosidase